MAEFLRSKQLLVVLDNCEHLLEPVAELVEFLQRDCAGLVILATSREGLAVEGERVVPVPSLPSPPPDAAPAVAGEADAVRLFVERARAVDPDFALTGENTVGGGAGVPAPGRCAVGDRAGRSPGGGDEPGRAARGPAAAV